MRTSSRAQARGLMRVGGCGRQPREPGLACCRQPVPYLRPDAYDGGPPELEVALHGVATGTMLKFKLLSVSSQRQVRRRLPRKGAGQVSDSLCRIKTAEAAGRWPGSSGCGPGALGERSDGQTRDDGPAASDPAHHDAVGAVSAPVTVTSVTPYTILSHVTLSMEENWFVTVADHHYN